MTYYYALLNKFDVCTEIGWLSVLCFCVYWMHRNFNAPEIGRNRMICRLFDEFNQIYSINMHIVEILQALDILLSISKKIELSFLLKCILSANDWLTGCSIYWIWYRKRSKLNEMAISIKTWFIKEFFSKLGPIFNILNWNMLGDTLNNSVSIGKYLKFDRIFG